MQTFTETQIVQAYFRLFVCPRTASGTKYVPLARAGAYEVRMRDTPTDEHSFWLDLYAHDRQDVVDSHGCSEFAEAAQVADELNFWAVWLHQRS
jgi:hypothetical protein